MNLIGHFCGPRGCVCLQSVLLGIIRRFIVGLHYISGVTGVRVKVRSPAGFYYGADCYVIVFDVSRVGA